MLPCIIWLYATVRSLLQALYATLLLIQPCSTTAVRRLREGDREIQRLPAVAQVLLLLLLLLLLLILLLVVVVLLAALLAALLVHLVHLEIAVAESVVMT